MRAHSQTHTQPRGPARPGPLDRRYFTTPGDASVRRGRVGAARRAHRPRRQGLVRAARRRVPEGWSQNATNIVAQKYFRGQLGLARARALGQADDRPRRRARSPAGAASAATSPPTRTRRRFEAELTHILLHQMAAFNSPVWFNVGFEESPQCSACFILSVEDDDGVDPRLEHQGGEDLPRRLRVGHQPVEDPRLDGAAGQGRHRVRARSASCAAPTPGPGTIKSGGKTRRAAKMVVLDVDHPDIREFIWCKAKEEDKAAALRDAGFDMSIDGEGFFSIQYQNANNSVRVTDEFMRAVENDEDWHLIARDDRRADRRADPGARADARDRRGGLALRRPGRAVRHDDQPVAHVPGVGPDQRLEPVQRVHARRRLGLQPGLAEPHEVPPRGRHVRRRVASSTPSTSCSWPRRSSSRRRATRPRRSAPTRARSASSGLGYANLGAYLMADGVPVRLRRRPRDGRRDHRADDRPGVPGLGPGRRGDRARTSATRRTASAHNAVMRMHRDASYAIPDSSCADTRAARRRARRLGRGGGRRRAHGYRNAQATVLAPTGTIRFLMDCDTTGIEPDFSLVKFKELVGGGQMTIVNQTVPLALQTLGLLRRADRADRGARRRAGHDRRRARPGRRAPAGVRRGGRRARDLAHGPHQDDGRGAAVHLRRDLQDREPAPDGDGRGHRRRLHAGLAARASRRWRSTATARRPRRPAHRRAEGASRGRRACDGPGQVDKAVDRGAGQGGAEARARCRASASRSRTSSRSPATRATSPPGMYEDGTVGEIFLTDIGKEGSTLRGMMNSFATAISIALQYGVPLETLVQKFSYMRFEPEGITSNPEIPFAKSMPDYIMRWLASRFLDTDAQEELGHPHAGGPRAQGGPGRRPARTSGHRRPGERRRRPTAGGTAARAAPRAAAFTDTPAGRCRRGCRARPRSGLPAVRRDDAADRLLLHVRELRLQHHLQLGGTCH